MKNERGSSPLDIADGRPEDLCLWNGYDEIWGMNAGVAGAIRRAGSATWAVGAMLFGLLRELVADAPDSSGLTDRQLHDSDLIGEYNHRTGRLDAGNDPYGWYDEE